MRPGRTYPESGLARQIDRSALLANQQSVINATINPYTQALHTFHFPRRAARRSSYLVSIVQRQAWPLEVGFFITSLSLVQADLPWWR